MYKRNLLRISYQVTRHKAQGLVYFQLANHKVDYIIELVHTSTIVFKTIASM